MDSSITKTSEFFIESSTFAQDLKFNLNSANSAAFGEVDERLFPTEAKTKPVARRKVKRNVNFKEFLQRKKDQKAQKRYFHAMNPESAATEGNQTVKKGRMLQIIGSTDKTPMQKLNECRVIYTLACEAVPNSMLFKATISMGDQLFTGIASSKQDAKQKVAGEALNYLKVEACGVEAPVAEGTLSAADVEAKTPTSIINEMFNKEQVQWSNAGEQKDPPSGPFLATLSIDGQGEFSGTGRSKKDARNGAALAAVLKLFNIPTLQGFSLEQIRAMIQQFRLRGVIAPIYAAQSYARSQMENEDARTKSVFFISGADSTSKAEPTKTVVAQPTTKSHLQQLNERFSPNNVQFEFIGEEGPPNQRTFHVKLKVGDTEKEFIASGSSKQEAKQTAAAMALAHMSLISPESVPAPRPASLPRSLPSVEVSPAKTPNHNQWSDFVSNLIVTKFQQLTEGTEWNRRTVLAGIVMTAGDDYIASAQPICIATGTKCLSANNMSMAGAALLDCHAEILCRRALCRYLYSHLLALDNEELAVSAIFERRPDGKPGYRLKPEFKFHLYISTAPCGDSRIFCPLDDASILAAATNGDRHPNRINRGLLRTKVESGEGTIPSVEECRQTWDGIHGGDRLVVVSCSDKILAWNHLGLQGNLLSQFIEPIYLTSIIVASAFSPDHLERALITRLPDAICEGEVGDDPKFTLHKPNILSVSAVEKRVPCKPPKTAFLWTVCDRAYEVIDCSTGRLIETGYPSSVSKLTMFRLFSTAESKLTKIFDVTDGTSALTNTYNDIKKRNRFYTEAKGRLLRAVLEHFLGYWPMKPIEIDSFILPIHAPEGAAKN